MIDRLPDKWRVKDCRDVSEWYNSLHKSNTVLSSKIYYLCVNQEKLPDSNATYWSYWYKIHDTEILEFEEITIEDFNFFILKGNTLRNLTIKIKNCDFIIEILEKYNIR